MTVVLSLHEWLKEKDVFNTFLYVYTSNVTGGEKGSISSVQACLKLIVTLPVGMKISIVEIGKTDNEYLRTGIGHYNSLTGKMVKLETITLPDIKKRGSVSQDNQKRIEGEKIVQLIRPGDHLILLDERGDSYDSIGFASYLESLMNRSLKRLLFVIGGPYGFSDEAYSAASARISLSPMTFSHQLVRLLFAEQLFRAVTLIRGIPYHNA